MSSSGSLNDMHALVAFDSAPAFRRFFDELEAKPQLGVCVSAFLGILNCGFVLMIGLARRRKLGVWCSRSADSLFSYFILVLIAESLMLTPRNTWMPSRFLHGRLLTTVYSFHRWAALPCQMGRWLCHLLGRKLSQQRTLVFWIDALSWASCRCGPHI